MERMLLLIPRICTTSAPFPPTRSFLFLVNRKIKNTVYQTTMNIQHNIYG